MVHLFQWLFLIQPNHQYWYIVIKVHILSKFPSFLPVVLFLFQNIILYLVTMSTRLLLAVTFSQIFTVFVTLLFWRKQIRYFVQCPSIGICMIHFSQEWTRVRSFDFCFVYVCVLSTWNMLWHPEEAGWSPYPQWSETAFESRKYRLALACFFVCLLACFFVFSIMVRSWGWDKYFHKEKKLNSLNLPRGPNKGLWRFSYQFSQVWGQKGRDGWGLKEVSSQTLKKKWISFFLKLSLFLLTLIMVLKYCLLGLLTIKLLICSPTFHLYTLEGIQHVQGKLNGIGHYLPPPWEQSIYIKYLYALCWKICLFSFKMYLFNSSSVKI